MKQTQLGPNLRVSTLSLALKFPNVTIQLRELFLQRIDHPTEFVLSRSFQLRGLRFELSASERLKGFSEMPSGFVVQTVFSFSATSDAPDCASWSFSA